MSSFFISFFCPFQKETHGGPVVGARLRGVDRSRRHQRPARGVFPGGADRLVVVERHTVLNGRGRQARLVALLGPHAGVGEVEEAGRRRRRRDRLRKGALGAAAG